MTNSRGCHAQIKSRLERPHVGFLGLVRVLTAGVHLKFFEELSSELVLGQHPLNGKTQKIFRLFFEKFLGGDLFKPCLLYTSDAADDSALV